MSLRIPSRTDFCILREERDWLVVAKPAPLLIHPTGKSEEVTLLGLLETARPSEDFHFVNRLDRETSGCVLVARSGGAARRLGRQMARRAIHKHYLAVVRGWPEWDETRLEAPLRRQGEFSESEIWVRQAVHPAGREAATGFTVLRRWEKGPERFSLLRCEPETGRTHQIRAHLEFLQHGIVGDKIYGGDSRAYLDFLCEGWTRDLAGRMILERQALHAAGLTWEWEHEDVIVNCPLPADLQALVLPERDAEI